MLIIKKWRRGTLHCMFGANFENFKREGKTGVNYRKIMRDIKRAIKSIQLIPSVIVTVNQRILLTHVHLFAS